MLTQTPSAETDPAANPRAVMLARLIAWSAAHDVPLDEALRRLQSPLYRGVSLLVGVPLAWVANLAFGMDSAAHDPALYLLRAEVAGGRPAADAVPDTLGGLLPGHLRRGLALALTDDAACTRLMAQLAALPPAGPRLNDLFGRLIGPGLCLIGMGTVYGFVALSISPRWTMMSVEFGGDPERAIRLADSWLTYGLLAFTSLLALGLLALPVTALLNRLQLGRWLVELPTCALPGLRGFYRLARAREAAQSVCTGLALGLDLPDALDWSLEVTDSLWLRRRLAAVATRWEAGEHWADAWVADGLAAGTGWELQAGRRREDPVAAFAALAASLASRQSLALRRLLIVSRVLYLVLATLYCGLLVALVTFSLGDVYSIVVEFSSPHQG